MTAPKLTEERFDQLISDVCATMEARRTLIAESGGRLTINVFPTRSNFEIRLTVTTR
jgi:hypothetical protein